MLPELLRHSDRADVFDRLPQHLKDAHRPQNVERDDAPARGPSTAASTSMPPLPALYGLWQTDDHNCADVALAIFGAGEDEDELALLEEAGF